MEGVVGAGNVVVASAVVVEASASVAATIAAAPAPAAAPVAVIEPEPEAATGELTPCWPTGEERELLRGVPGEKAG